MSKRSYLSITEAFEMVGLTVTEEQINVAEELIDAYVGSFLKFMQHHIIGRATSATANTLTLQTRDRNTFDINYFKWLTIEILSGTGEGQTRTIQSSTKDGVLTVSANFTTTPDATSMYRIYQLGKFPRQCDVQAFSEVPPTEYVKRIPDQIKRAVAYQLEYIAFMGDAYFKDNIPDSYSESVGDYSESKTYSKGAGLGISLLIGSKAKAQLHGFLQRSGRIEL